jgi:hypothetical protein
MKARIVSKNAIRSEGDDHYRTEDNYPIIIGKMGLTDINNPITSGAALLMLEVYLFHKDFKYEN